MYKYENVKTAQFQNECSICAKLPIFVILITWLKID